MLFSFFPRGRKEKTATAVASEGARRLTYH